MVCRLGCECECEALACGVGVNYEVYGLYGPEVQCMAGSGKFSVIIRKELYELCSTRAKYSC